jgi:hypothetical protein
MAKLKRRRLTPEGEIDFGHDGGAYPDIHVDQFPHGIGKMGDKVRMKGCILSLCCFPRHQHHAAVLGQGHVLHTHTHTHTHKHTHKHIPVGMYSWLYFALQQYASRRCSRVVSSVHVMETCPPRGEVKIRITNRSDVQLASSPPSEAWL